MYITMGDELEIIHLWLVIPCLKIGVYFIVLPHSTLNTFNCKLRQSNNRVASLCKKVI